MVVNSVFDFQNASAISPNPQPLAARYFIFDDGTTGFAELATADLFPAKVADVSLGDIDGDGTDEIVFAGLTGGVIDRHQGRLDYEYAFLALEDAAADNALQSIGQKTLLVEHVRAVVHKVHVNTLDIDGDGIDEIQANYRIFKNWKHNAPWTGHSWAPVRLYSGGRVGEPDWVMTISDATSACVVADVDGDGRDNIISYVQGTNRKFSVAGFIGEAWTTIALGSLIGDGNSVPIIVPFNQDIDDDSMVLKYASEHRLVFTEPIIIAALAAPPCRDSASQNLGACSTSYGQSQTQSSGSDTEVSVSVGSFVGFEAKAFGFGVEGQAGITETVNFSTENSYTIETSVVFTGGPNEDTIVFSSIPLDQYVYTIVAHSDPAAVGTSMVVNVPRSPIITQAERGFFNRSLRPGGYQVGPEVFKHTTGVPESYPSERVRDELIGTDSSRGLKSDPVTVGQGGGSTSGSISVGTSTTYGSGASVEFDAEIAATAGGAKVGMSIGAGFSSGISWGSGEATQYSFSVGSLNDGPGYTFGMFTYIHDDPTQQFEVINYWVSQPQ